MDTRLLRDLSKKERTLALRGLAQDSLPHFGLDGGSLILLQDLVNSSFRVRHDSGHWYMRIYSPDRHDARSIESELLFMEGLAADGFPSPRPLRNGNGNCLWVSPRHLSLEPIRISVCSWLEGTPLQNGKTPEHFARIGAMLARFHSFSANWTLPHSFTRPRCDSEGVYGEFGVLGRQVYRAWHNASGPLRTALEHAKDALRQAEYALGDDKSCYGLIHADPSFGNILFDGYTPSLIDFDDCGYAHYVFDLAVVLAGAWDKPAFDENRDALLQCYRRTRELSSEEVAALPAAMAARASSLILWCLTQSPKHPSIEDQWKRLDQYMQI